MFGGHEAKFYYVGEDPYGVTPVNPAMKGIEIVKSIAPAVNQSNIKLRGCGSRDLKQIKKVYEKYV